MTRVLGRLLEQFECAVGELAHELVWRFAFFAPLFKNRHLSEEVEWRMIISELKGVPYPHENVDFYPRGRTIRPVYKVKLNIDADAEHKKIGLRHIVVGPGPEA